MEFEGKVIQDYPVVEGIAKSTNKPWRKKEWILETLGNYPRKVKIQAFNERIDNLNLQIGQTYVVSVDAESREFNGRWYTDLSAYAARPAMTQAPAPAAPAPDFGGGYAAPAGFGASAAPEMPANNQEDDLPF